MDGWPVAGLVRKAAFRELFPTKCVAPAPVRGDENTPATTYSEGMNNPWSNLVETLSGTEHRTPHSWPERRVHRMLDDAPPARSPAREPRPVVKVDRRPSMMQAPAPVMRSRCPCTECQPGLSRIA